MKYLLLLFFLGWNMPFLWSQQADLAFEFQAYPTGLIPGIRLEKLFKSNAYHLRLGYNWIRHGDAGVHEDERGSGFGLTLGYKRYFSDQDRFFLGARSDIWFNSMDWKNNIGTSNETNGNTKIVVVQPTAEFGYLVFLQRTDWYIVPTVAFGVEINTKTKGEPVGEGLVLLVGIQVGKRF
jgi:hypothetical protein